MKTICKYLGGSRSYSLHDEKTSDFDKRGVFVNTEINKIIGLNRFDHLQKQDKDDEVYFEVRHFFSLLKNGNSQAIESLFISPSDFFEYTSEWETIMLNREKLLDTEKLFKCICGYAQSERRLFLGERTGALGGKRKEAIDKFGYSPKNFCQLVRLLWAASYFFELGVFPVNLSYYNVSLRDFLLDVKYSPEKYDKNKLLKASLEHEETMKKSFDNRDKNKDYKFDDEFANRLLLDIYKPFLI